MSGRALTNPHLLNFAIWLLIIALVIALSACSLQPSEGYGWSRCYSHGDWSIDDYCTAIAKAYRM